MAEGDMVDWQNWQNSNIDKMAAGKMTKLCTV